MPDLNLTLTEQIAALEHNIAARPHSGELLWADYRKLADLQRQRAEEAEAMEARWQLAYQQMSDAAGELHADGLANTAAWKQRAEAAEAELARWRSCAPLLSEVAAYYAVDYTLDALGLQRSDGSQDMPATAP